MQVFFSPSFGSRGSGVALVTATLRQERTGRQLAVLLDAGLSVIVRLLRNCSGSSELLPLSLNSATFARCLGRSHTNQHADSRFNGQICEPW